MQRTEEQWADIARYVRHAYNKVGETPLPLCLPGEPQQCGQTARQHVLGWAAELKAVAHHLIEDTAETAAEGTYFASAFHQERLAAHREARPKSA